MNKIIMATVCCGMACFASGILVGATHVAFAERPPSQPMLRLNHVAVNVVDLAAALQYYRDKFGFQEVTRLTGANQEPLAAYLQVSRDTFIELWQTNVQHPPGLDHFGFEVADIKAAAEELRKHELTVSEVMGPMPFSGGFIANISDPNTGRIELSAQPAGGKLRRATENWR
jgi:catechol 2,3-dioxygenase-like lactoylglutathione lyase family enzyme